MTTSSCSPKARSPTKSFWSTSTICSPQDRLLSCTPPMRNNRLSTLSETKSKVRAKLIRETTPTAGTGTSIKSSRSCTCPCVSPPLARVSEEEPGSSPPWSTPPLSTGSSPGPRMPCSTWLTDSSRNKILEMKPREPPSSNSCPSPSTASTNCPPNCSKSSEDTSTPPPNPSLN